MLVVPEHAFAVEVPPTSTLALSHEHRAVRWCRVPEAMELLRFDSNKHALWELHERMFPGPRTKRTVYR